MCLFIECQARYVVPSGFLTDSVIAILSVSIALALTSIDYVDPETRHVKNVAERHFLTKDSWLTQVRHIATSAFEMKVKLKKWTEELKTKESLLMLNMHNIQIYINISSAYLCSKL